ncbi:MAG TPA: hypothetical protein VGJ91_10620 [Polyangiaceae bacterium]|jgi:hypothetical protein
MPQSDDEFQADVEQLYQQLCRACVGHSGAVVLTAAGFALAAAGRHAGVSLEDVVAELRNQWLLLEQKP